MNMFEIIYSLDSKQVLKLQTELTTAGIGLELGEFEHKRYFKLLYIKSKGKIKRIYQALYQADKADFDRVCAALVKEIS